ncbi:hypothetical protein CRUP_002948 [Coryphaenoides rupestris]|nr:hypothetical protein CRUP_002948 [Coryphaenoides rupestris]
MTDIRSSTPFTPLGILVKSSLPRAFWHTEKVQLSVPWGAHDEARRVGPVFVPAVSAVGAQAGRDGLPEHHASWGERTVDGVGDGDGSMGGLSLHRLRPTHLMALGPRDAQGQHLLSPL